MASVFLAALFALTASGGDRPPAAPAPLDLQCYRLMASLAREDDPLVRSAGMTGAQYFLGRIDAAAPGFSPDEDSDAPAAVAARAELVQRCGAIMGAGGRDFRALGQRLRHEERPTV